MARYNKEHGFEADCDVIYGDTDSVMVNFKALSLPPPSPPPLQVLDQMESRAEGGSQ